MITNTVVLHITITVVDIRLLSHTFCESELGSDLAGSPAAIKMSAWTGSWLEAPSGPGSTFKPTQLTDTINFLEVCDLMDACFFKASDGVRNSGVSVPERWGFPPWRHLKSSTSMRMAFRHFFHDQLVRSKSWITPTLKGRGVSLSWTPEGGYHDTCLTVYLLAPETALKEPIA